MMLFVLKFGFFFSPEASSGFSLSGHEATRTVAFRSIPSHSTSVGCQDLLQTYRPGRDETWGCFVIFQTSVLVCGVSVILQLLSLTTV